MKYSSCVQLTVYNYICLSICRINVFINSIHLKFTKQNERISIHINEQKNEWHH